MYRVINTVILAGVLFSSGQHAFASDEYLPKVSAIESGWYLRGDVSFNISGRQDSGFSEFDYSGENTTFDYEDAYSVSVGFGRQENEFFRWDVNFELLMESDFESDSNATFAGSETQTRFINVNGTIISEEYEQGVAVSGREKIERSYSAINNMVNGYVDLGDYQGFRPYLGAGVGLAQITNTEKITWTCTPESDAVNCGGGGKGETITSVVQDESAEKWVMSYGLNAGFSYTMAENTLLDVGYQYLNVGGGPVLNYDDGGAFEGVETHRVKVGMRYLLN